MELVSGVAQLHPEDAMLEAMLPGWHAQQVARGLREDTIGPRERLVRRFGEFAGEYPWQWSPGHMDEWSLHHPARQADEHQVEHPNHHKPAMLPATRPTSQANP